MTLAKATCSEALSALLFPIDWPEPFGLVMIEAMACGTPVIAYRRGSVPEVIDDGVTGFIVDSEEEALAAIGRVGELGPTPRPSNLRATLHGEANGRGLPAALREAVGDRPVAATSARRRGRRWAAVGPQATT